jgi:hypothetical protein
MLLVSVQLFAANTVEMVVGTATVQPAGTSSWSNVFTGQKIRNGDTIQTGSRSFVVVDVNGNTVKIQSGTKVKFAQDMGSEKPQTSVSLFRGSLNCIMGKLKKNRETFGVNTASSICAIRGTEFEVGSGADGSTVLQVTEGLVAFSGLSASVDVAKNQESSVMLGREPEPVKIIKRRDWDAWADEASRSVKGNEGDILAGCLAKLNRLDADIIQLEKESAAAKAKSNELHTQAEAAKKSGNDAEWTRLAGDAEKSSRFASSLTNQAYYQASRIELVKAVADNAYTSAERKSSVQKHYDKIDAIYTRYYTRYIKPILDSEKRRQDIRDNKKKKINN